MADPTRKNILSREDFDIPDFGSSLGSMPMAGDDFFKALKEAAKSIYETVNYSPGQLQAVLDIPGEREMDNETLALAIEHLLSTNFNIKLPGEHLMAIKQGNSVKFTTKSNPELPPRLVQILLEATQRFMKITGKEPQNGRNGYSDLNFNWKKKSGEENESGIFDLKKLNAFSSARQNETLATIYLKTDGTPGINCMGKAIKQQKGLASNVKWNQMNINRAEDPSDSTTYHLKAIKAGIVDFSLRNPSDPKTLRKIDITDTITINGDVDYGVGDIGGSDDKDTQCVANIVIRGSVLGVFSLQSSGYIHVTGSIEGRSVIARDIETGLITAGSSAIAEQEIKSGGIINAKAEAATIIVKSNASQSILSARDKITFEPNSASLGNEFYCKKADFKQVKISGVNKFHLGTELFKETDRLLGLIGQGEDILQERAPAVKETALAILSHLVKLHEISKKGRAADVMGNIRKVIDGLKSSLIPVFQKAGSTIDPNVIPLCYRMQSIFGNHKFDDSILRKVDLLIESIKKYNSMQDELNITRKQQHEYAEQFTGFKNQIINDLELQFEAIKFASGNAELKIECGESLLSITDADVTSSSFTVKYMIKESEDNLRKGTLQLNYMQS